VTKQNVKGHKLLSEIHQNANIRLPAN